MENKKNLLIGCSGSVAVCRLLEIVDNFKEKYNLRVILTEKAKFFCDSLIKDYEEFEKMNKIKFYYDKDEWDEFTQNKKVLHIEVN